MSFYDFRKHVSESLAISNVDVIRLIVRAPHTYKKYEIEKKSGGKRLIAQPAKETKVIQRLLIDEVFSCLPVHDCAVAYKEGASIRKNAERHKDNQFISKFDFSNFFGSITELDVIAHLVCFFSERLTEQSMKDIARVSCIKHRGNEGLCLSVGAPSSPVLSNSIMYAFDMEVEAWCAKRSIVYTRYADDLTFSSNEKGMSTCVEPFLVSLLGSLPYPSLSLNSQKTVHVSKKHQRRVTGLVINNDGVVSLGRERKRLISSMIHHYVLGILNDESILHLQGLLGFAEDAEPLFVSRMRGKYGGKHIAELLRRRGKGGNKNVRIGSETK